MIGSLCDSETQGLNLLFYRKDIFEYLDIKPPKTWDDVIKDLQYLRLSNELLYPRVVNHHIKTIQPPRRYLWSWREVF